MPSMQRLASASLPGDLKVPLLEKLCTQPRLLRCVAANGVSRAHVQAALVATCCIIVGVLHPLATEAAKSARVTVCTAVEDGGVVCSSESAGGADDVDMRRQVMPFHAATLTVASELLSVMVTMVVLVHVAPEASAAKAIGRLLDPRKLLRLWPIGLVYGLGDFIQTVACNSASAPVVLVIGQSKLLLAALLSRSLLKRNQSTNWFRLLVISCAAAAGADIGSGTVGSPFARREELRGAFLALLKAGLSSAGAVLSERDYKQEDESFWVVSLRVQSMMLCTSLLLLPWTGANWEEASLTEFFFGGPWALCTASGPGGAASCALPSSLQGSSCSCVDRRGWDRMTMLAATFIAVNGFVTGLTLKHLSAVTKTVCNALSTGVFYIAYVCLGFRPFSMAQANILLVVIISSYEYAIEKAESASQRWAKPCSLCGEAELMPQRRAKSASP